jgi:hypothetical protein
MSNPASQPVIPPQPNLIAYGVQDLALFKTYTRDRYRAAFGVEAPLWNPARLRKTWFDSTVDTSSSDNVAVYKIAAQDPIIGWTMKQMVIPAQEAATVNLPGAIVYPAYNVAPTDATRGGSQINPNYLSLESEARALMAIVGGTDLVQDGNTAVFPVVYPADEPRRMWAIIYKGRPVNVGNLLLNINSKGVGAPGKWDSSSSEPVWVPASDPPTGLDDTRPPREMPVRDLLPNEKFQMGLMGVSIIRTDLAQQQAQQDGQFTPDDRATLQQIYQIVSRLGV